MQIIFGAGQATGRFAMGSNEPLGTSSSITETNMSSKGITQGVGGSGATAASVNDGNGGASLATASASQGTRTAEETANLGKRRRLLTDEEVGIMTGLTGAVSRVTEAFNAPIRVQKTEVHPDLYVACMGIPGFNEDLMTALTFLLDNKRQGEGFVTMTVLAQIYANAHSDSDSN